MKMFLSALVTGSAVLFSHCATAQFTNVDSVDNRDFQAWKAQVEQMLREHEARLLDLEPVQTAQASPSRPVSNPGSIQWGWHGGRENNGVGFDERLRAAAELGCTWIRFTGPLSFIIERGERNWQFLDRPLALAEELGLNVFLTVRLGRNQSTTLDTSLLRKAVSRYASVEVWQFGNEISNDRFWPRSKRDYVDFLNAGYNVVSPSARVAMAGAPSMSFGAEAFYDDILSMGPRFDIFDDHLPPNRTGPEAVAGEVAKVRALLNKHGYKDVPIWSTEFLPLGPASGNVASNFRKYVEAVKRTEVTHVFVRGDERPWQLLSGPGQKTSTYNEYKSLIGSSR